MTYFPPIVLRQRHDNQFILHREGMAPVATLGRMHGETIWTLVSFHNHDTWSKFDSPEKAMEWLTQVFPEVSIVWRDANRQNGSDWEENAKVVAAFYEKHPENPR